MHVCNPSNFDFSDTLDVWSFGQYFNGVIGGTVQYNGFYTYTIDNICNTLTDPNNGEPLDRYAIMTQQIYGGGCFNIEYEGFLDSSLSVHTPNA